MGIGRGDAHARHGCALLGVRAVRSRTSHGNLQVAGEADVSAINSTLGSLVAVHRNAL
jgi:hypothetical protein